MVPSKITFYLLQHGCMVKACGGSFSLLVAMSALRGVGALHEIGRWAKPS